MEPPRDHSSYIAGLQRRARDAEEARRSRAALARERVSAIARTLVSEFGAVRVVLFGSLAEGGFHESSDIDLIAWGIAGDRWFAADAAAAALAEPFELDLVRGERALPSLLARVASEGEVLVDGRR